MDGLLLKLLDDHQGAPGKWFWKLFAPVKQQMDRHYWCFNQQPWMGPPTSFVDNPYGSTKIFEGMDDTSVMLWKPGTLSQFAKHFCNDYIELWAIDPAKEDPCTVVSHYAQASESQKEQIIRKHSAIDLLYTDSSCWEIYSITPTWLLDIRDHVCRITNVEVYSSHFTHRSTAFQKAGLSHIMW